MSGGFRDEDSDFADLLTRQPTTLSGSNTSYSYPASDEDLASNPFADMESSRANYAPSNPMAYSPPSQPNNDFSAPNSPPFEQAFTRESAPEPETPAQVSRAPSPDYAYTPQPDLTSPSFLAYQTFSPLETDSQTPFGSPPSSPTTGAPRFGHGRQQSKADIVAALLGEEKPILPTFRREASMSEGGPTLHSNAPVLPVSSIGKRSVGGPLAALLGLEEDEVKPVTRVTPAPEPKLEASKDLEVSKAEPPATATGATTPELTIDIVPSLATTDALPPSESTEATPIATAVSTPQPVDETPIATIAPPILAALTIASTTPLPPSPSQSPPPGTPTPIDSADASRSSSLATSETSATNEAYDSMVSPMDTSDGTIEASSGWPGKEAVSDSVEGLEERLEGLNVADGDSGTTGPAPPQQDEPKALSTPRPSTPPPSTSALPSSPQSPFGQSTFHDTAHAPALTSPLTVPRTSLFEQTSPSRGFRSYNGSSFDDGNGFGNGTDDGDSLRGTYSRSVEVEEETETEGRTGMGSPVTEKTREENLRTVALDSERGSVASGNASLLSSPPLPAIPTMPSVQGSPRSTDLGGSLGPSFIITVGDPQKIGSSLNVAAQHTVYTVRTRTTSSAFRKPEFSVLRRFSHFLWLFDALTLNNPGVIVPGMPEKSAIGRFGSDFVENRRSALQSALMKIVSHPMLVGDPDLRLFLESDSFSVDIKQRKMDSPSESKGFFGSLGTSISGPKFVEFDEYFDTRRQTLDAFETQLRALLVSLSSAAKVRMTLQTSLGELQSAFLGLSQCDLSGPLRGALEHAASVQRRLRELSEQQSISEEQIGGLTNVAEGYARLCGSVKLVFGARIKSYHAWQAAESNLRKARISHEKAKKSGRSHSDMLGLSFSEISDAERKTLDAKQDFEDVSKLTKAEMARFDKEKVEDFKKAVEDYVEGMLVRQREVVATWQSYYDLLLRAAGANTSTPVLGGPLSS